MLDALSLDQMRMFLTVAETGSFRAAALRLGRVQSAVSHAIARLEDTLGVALFDRGGHRPVLTAEGKALLVHVRDVLLRVDALRARARGLGSGVELELSLTVDVLFPPLLLGAALAETSAAYPSVGIRLSAEALGGPVTALLDKRSQLAIVVGESFRDPRIALEALTAIDMIAVVAASHPLARAPGPLDAAALADHLQIVQFDPSPLTGQRDIGVVSPRTCRVGGQDIKHAMILAGLGWGRLPGWLAAEDLARGRLVRVGTGVLGRQARLPMEAYLGHRLDEPLGPAARSFAGALARLCAGAEATPETTKAGP
ncbi:LysR family transcriptional regulator [Bosea sp. (in: a-proteobacteria)]|uniref:LysR family transcriptional regulator n=1 Tax=Bosea sp. (in: a-proteobacteria) TaxID=1871050 RepID=UPI00333E8DD5